MNTPAHAVFNLALLAQQKEPQWNPLIVWGAVIPDLSMFGFYLWMRLATDIPEGQVWRVDYFKPAWQTLFDYFHSIPLALLGLRRYALRQASGNCFAVWQYGAALRNGADGSSQHLCF